MNTTKVKVLKSPYPIAQHKGKEKIVQVQALYDLEKQNEHALKLVKGDIIEVVDKVNNDWWHGCTRIRNGNPVDDPTAVGMFPVTYCQAYAIEKKKKIRIRVPQSSKIRQLQQSVFAARMGAADKKNYDKANEIQPEGKPLKHQPSGNIQSAAAALGKVLHGLSPASSPVRASSSSNASNNNNQKTNENSPSRLEHPTLARPKRLSKTPSRVHLKNRKSFRTSTEPEISEESENDFVSSVEDDGVISMSDAADSNISLDNEIGNEQRTEEEFESESDFDDPDADLDAADDLLVTECDESDMGSEEDSEFDLSQEETEKEAETPDVFCPTDATQSITHNHIENSNEDKVQEEEVMSANKINEEQKLELDTACTLAMGDPELVIESIEIEEQETQVPDLPIKESHVDQQIETKEILNAPAELHNTQELVNDLTVDHIKGESESQISATKSGESVESVELVESDSPDSLSAITSTQESMPTTVVNNQDSIPATITTDIVNEEKPQEILSIIKSEEKLLPATETKKTLKEQPTNVINENKSSKATKRIKVEVTDENDVATENLHILRKKTPKSNANGSPKPKTSVVTKSSRVSGTKPTRNSNTPTKPISTQRSTRTSLDCRARNTPTKRVSAVVNMPKASTPQPRKPQQTKRRRPGYSLPPRLEELSKPKRKPETQSPPVHQPRISAKARNLKRNQDVFAGLYSDAVNRQRKVSSSPKVSPSFQPQISRFAKKKCSTRPSTVFDRLYTDAKRRQELESEREARRLLIAAEDKWE